MCPLTQFRRSLGLLLCGLRELGVLTVGPGRCRLGRPPLYIPLYPLDILIRKTNQILDPICPDRLFPPRPFSPLESLFDDPAKSVDFTT